MSISSIFGSPVVLLSKASLKQLNVEVKSAPKTATGNGWYSGGLVIECSSRPKKKATAHHMKTRPKKSQPWDIRRKPTVYPPLPPLPPDWTLVSSASDNGDGDGDGAAVTQAALSSAPALQPPITSG
ncbi:50S ribosomal protein 6, chloroplastic [Ricinus communis]|uniref:50S ribosomal protein CL25, chloroplast, putative n=1 Tax=Ricinus communis TaxID=3988 RepID=B9R6S5_RICCO|nr:50S ribosomal protein 6, chloroplastic [Ricinus communis]EEF52205.1 50S ribosomal protein CL25, chloroplast precursor, putative [Ricinus communis]|eukprot:XP_002510018.1 50S ribosomal protein 6, chloroplastic [Ricinus communis]